MSSWRPNPDPVATTALLILGAGVAWVAVNWWQKRSLPPPTATGTGNLCAPGTVAATMGLSIAYGTASGAAAGAPVAGFGAIPGALIGAVAGTAAGLAKVFAAQLVCDEHVCGNLNAAYSDLLARGQGGGRVAHLVRLVKKARRRGETCNGMTDTAGRTVGA